MEARARDPLIVHLSLVISPTHYKYSIPKQFGINIFKFIFLNSLFLYSLFLHRLCRVYCRDSDLLMREPIKLQCEIKMREKFARRVSAPMRQKRIFIFISVGSLLFQQNSSATPRYKSSLECYMGQPVPTTYTCNVKSLDCPVNFVNINFSYPCKLMQQIFCAVWGAK